ncbi:transposable element Tcb1 transposase [Trichonephila clavipes]|nr:transposable element Tcb1 transposase [Trichonephila clavipes]
MLNSCVMHRNIGSAPGIMVWGGIGYHSRTLLVSIAGTLNSQRYISEVLQPVVLTYLQGLATAIFQKNNARPHVTRIVQRFFVNRQLELLPWPACSPDLSLIENMWSMIAQRLTWITPPATTPDQLWQPVEASWSAVPQEHIQSLFESMPRRVAALISNNELWFQQDGATCHTARTTIDLLKDTFGDRLISRFGPVNWPPRSCDLTPLDCFLWGYVKSLVYADKPQTPDHLEDNIRRVIADIRPQMLEKVSEN